MERNQARETGVRGRVLLIDDDEVELSSLTDLIASGGYEVLQRSSPIGATQMIASQNVAAVVVNMSSPAMAGPRFASLLASWDRVRDVPIVLIASDANVAREASAQRKRVLILRTEQVQQTLLRVLERALTQRTHAAPSQSGVMPVRPSVRLYARTGLEAWRSFVDKRAPLQTVLMHLVSLRSEASALGLEQTTELVGLVMEVLAQQDPTRAVSVDLDQCTSELLQWLVTLEVDRGRAFDRSLTLSLHRARFERLYAS